MKRREFFKYSAIGGTALPLVGLEACKPAPDPIPEVHQTSNPSLEAMEKSGVFYMAYRL